MGTREEAENALGDNPLTIHVGIVDHNYGSNVYLGYSEDEVWTQIEAFAREWWADEGLPEPIPEDRWETICAYFEHVDHETYTLTTTTLRRLASAVEPSEL